MNEVALQTTTWQERFWSKRLLLRDGLMRKSPFIAFALYVLVFVGTPSFFYYIYGDETRLIGLFTCSALLCIVIGTAAVKHVLERIVLTKHSYYIACQSCNRMVWASLELHADTTELLYDRVTGIYHPKSDPIETGHDYVATLHCPYCSRQLHRQRIPFSSSVKLDPLA